MFMKRSEVLIQQRASKIAAQTALNEKLTTEKRDAFTAEETTAFRALQTEIDALSEQIKDAETYERNLILGAQQRGVSAMDKGPGGEDAELEKIAKRFSLHKALDDMAEGRSQSGVEKEVYDEGVKRANAAGQEYTGFVLPSQIQKRFAGQSVTQDSGEYGAALVVEEYQGMIDYLRPKPITEQMGATYLSDLQGDAVFMVNEGGIQSYWEGEIDSGQTSKNKYSRKKMSPNRLYTGVPLTIQNIKQSSYSLEGLTINSINAAMAQALDVAVINGTGANDQPTGILNTSGLPVIAIGTNGGPLTWAQIVAMETGVFVENANAAKMAYAVNSVTKGKLKTTKHEAGDLGYLMALDNTINGYNVGVSNNVPGNITKGNGTNLSAAIFGDWTQVVIGQWGFVDLVLDKSTAGSGYYIIHVNGYYDVLVKQIKAFTAIKDITTT
jgi:HK97 family phage major capsid protein